MSEARTPAKLPDALTKALGQVIATERATWRKQLAEMQEEMRQAIVEMHARVEAAGGGKLPPVKQWTPRVFRAGELVAHGGSCWQADIDTAREPPHDWICIAQGGRSLRVRATWRPEEKYGALDVVALNGASFIARRDDPGPCPGEDWQLLAAQGKKGERPPQPRPWNSGSTTA